MSKHHADAKRRASRQTLRQRRSCLAAALAYAAEQDWRVFPLDGKVPYAGTHGHHDATNDPKQIRRWWREWPRANVGVACDSSTGPIVIDVDGASGLRWLRGITLPKTREACSRTGRRHLYFAPMSDGTAVKRMIRPLGNETALDILGDGGYVVAPPSVHPDTGLPYKWTRRVKLAPFPSSVFELIRSTSDVNKIAPPLPDIIHEGERDTLLTSLAGTMRRRGASEGSILAALREENATRVQPPLPDHQIERIARSIGRKPPSAQGGRARRVVVRLSTVKPERVRWLVPGFLPLGKFAIIEGDPGTGKSTLTLHIAARITTGRSVLGHKLAAPRNIVLVTYEDGLADTVRPRIDALGGNPRRVWVFRGVATGSDDSTERQLELTRFRGRLTRPNFGAEVAHEIESEGGTAGAARLQR